LFGISRQAVYQRINRSQKRSDELLQVKSLIVDQRMQLPRLGTRKLYYLLTDLLEEHQLKIGRDGLFDLLRAEGMLIIPKKSYTKTTNSKHWLRKHPNLLKEVQPQAPDEVYVSDITYIKSKERTHYLSLVTDAYSRKIVGYHLSNDMSSENVVKALKMANRSRPMEKQTIHHSDRGLQYCSWIYQNELAENNIIPSMTDGYDCYQNALAERMNGILKQEFLTHKCKNGEELNKMIKQSINSYNNLRPHLSLNMKTPNQIHKKTCELFLAGSS
jgi:transposase InsO family protein